MNKALHWIAAQRCSQRAFTLGLQSNCFQSQKCSLDKLKGEKDENIYRFFALDCILGTEWAE